MKKPILYILFIFIFIAGTFAQEQRELLGKAYNKKSPQLLEQFFDNWQKEMPTVNRSDLDTMDRLVREAYHVFESVYIPFSRRNSTPSFDSLFKRKYILIQADIRIKVVEKVYYTEDEEKAAIKYALDSLGYDSSKVRVALLPKNRTRVMGSAYNRYLNEYVYNEPANIEAAKSFRPFIKHKNLIPLYASEKYINLIENFLGKTFFDQDITKAKFKKAKEMSMDKLSFLNTLSYGIRYGCFVGDCWRFVNGPRVSQIVFDRDFQYVNVYYWDGDSKYMAQLKKEMNGQWKILFINLIAQI